MKSWVASAFSDNKIFNESNEIKRSAKIAKTTSKFPSIDRSAATSVVAAASAGSLNKKLLFTDKYRPKLRSDLVVNKSKVDQLSNVLDKTFEKTTGSIILIEGPSGTGKTTTLEILCTEKNIDLIKWTMPNTTLNKLNFTNQLESDNFIENNYDSQINLFQQFLYKSSRYMSDQIFNTELKIRNKKLLFLKEVPYFAHRDISSFQSLLRNFSKFSKYSLIVCLSNSSISNETNPSKIFSQDFRKELKIVEVNFNPLASTYLQKHLDKIIKCENLDFLDKNFINEVVTVSNGDIRQALNLIELASIPNTNNYSIDRKLDTKIKRKAPSGSKEKKLKNLEIINSTDSDLTKHAMSSLTQQKDINFSIFRGIGKVLHRKNLENTTNEENEKYKIESKLPSRLRSFYRKPLAYEPESILSKIPISEDSITMYLYQNYIDLFAIKSANHQFEDTFDSLCSINENFILSDLISTKLNSMEQGNQVYNFKYKEIPVLISIRSILFNLYFDEDKSVGGRSMWMPLHKPFNYKIKELKNQRLMNVRRLVEKESNIHLANYLIEMPNEFFINILPYSILKGQFRELAMSFNNSVVLKHKMSSTKVTNLNENDDEGFLGSDESNETNFSVEKCPNNKQDENICKNSNSTRLTKLYHYDNNSNIEQIDDFEF